MKQPPCPGPNYPALLELLRTAETLWHASRLYFARWDLSSSQFNILNLLFESTQGQTQVELSRLLIMHRSNVTGLVDRLEKRGLLQRQQSPQDRRAHCVVLTAAGRNLVAEILPQYYQVAEQIWEGIPPARSRLLLQDLKNLSSNSAKLAETMLHHE